MFFTSKTFTSKTLQRPCAAVLAVLASFAATADAQVLPNHDFEAGTAQWSNWGGFALTSDAHTGAQAAHVIGTGGFGSSTLVGVTPGDTYTLSAYAKISGAPSYAGIGVHFFDAGRNQVGQDSLSIASASFSLAAKDIVIPANVGHVRIWAWVSGSGSLTLDDVALVHAVPEPPAPAAEYFVDVNGDDANSGLQGHPWRTLARASAQDLVPGDVLHLTGGQTFSGTLDLTAIDSGSINAPVRIRSTGTIPAVIDANADSGLRLSRVTDVEVENIVLLGAGRNGGNSADGLVIRDSHRISVSHVEVSGFQHAGLLSHNSSDVSLTYIHAHDNGFAGIHGNSDGQGIGNRSRNLYIGYSRAVNNPGDPTVTDNHSGNGIVVGNVDNVTIEYCFAEENGWDMPRLGNGPVGIWIWESDSSLLQFNIARRNRTPAGANDGGGFDLDGGVTNSIMQYNISYENDGAGYGLFQYAGAGPWYNNTIRYNISENDGTQNPGGISVWTASSDDTMRDAYIYNNVVYNTAGPAINQLNNWQSNFNYANNIFVYSGDGIAGTFDSTASTFIGNLWHAVDGGFSVAGYDSLQSLADGTGAEYDNGTLVGRSASPGFAAAGSSQISDPALIPQYLNYRLNSDSPAINAGVDVSALYEQAAPAADLSGGDARVGPAVDMGAHEFPIAIDGPAAPLECNPNPDSANLLSNPGFEQQVSGYYVWGNAGAVGGNAYEGSAAFRSVGANAGAIQTVTNLAPNTTYYFSGWGTSSETAPDAQLMLGVKNYVASDGSDQIVATYTDTAYTCKYLAFTTGASNTSAELFLYQWQGSGTGYADALRLTRAGAVPPPPGPGPGDTLNILTLGDSITQSNAVDLGYRYYFWQHLINNNYRFDLIGSHSTVWLDTGQSPPTYPSYQGVEFDQDHEGHAGWTTQNIVQGHPNWGAPDGLSQWVQGYTADVVLMHIGTNDVWYHSWPPNAEVSASWALAYVEQMIDILQADNPDVTIFLAQIIPYASWYWHNSYDFDAFVRAFNAGIPGVAARKSTVSSDIVVVDHFTGFDDSLISNDGIHPNDAGQRAIAQRWIDALNAYYQ